jgi:hypothetical protein
MAGPGLTDYEGKDEKMPTVVERLGVLEVEIETALQGVSNFRKHSERANTFFDKSEERWQIEEKRRVPEWSLTATCGPQRNLRLHGVRYYHHFKHERACDLGRDYQPKNSGRNHFDQSGDENRHCWKRLYCSLWSRRHEHL